MDVDPNLNPFCISDLSNDPGTYRLIQDRTIDRLENGFRHIPNIRDSLAYGPNYRIGNDNGPNNNANNSSAFNTSSILSTICYALLLWACIDIAISVGYALKKYITHKNNDVNFADNQILDSDSPNDYDSEVVGQSYELAAEN